jgi:8-oxo-dGTP pyrophosphatase MutT (NUDIX family)
MHSMSSLDTAPRHATPYDAGTSLAGAIIEHPTHGFLLQLRDEQAPTYPLHWSLFGGHLEGDESPEVGLWRELAEELTFTPAHADAWRLVQRNPRPHGGTQFIYHIVTRVELDALVLGEGKAMRYVAPAAVLGYQFAANGLRIFQDHLAGRRDDPAATQTP